MGGYGSGTWSRKHTRTTVDDVYRVDVRQLWRHGLLWHWMHGQQTMELEWTSLHYGGDRPWFRCPGCGDRVAMLYAAGAGWQCRHCYGLPYASQQETTEARLRRKVHKLRTRLGASQCLSEPIWGKPKRMHWHTFEQLLAEENVAQLALLHVMHVTIEHLEAWCVSRT